MLRLVWKSPQKAEKDSNKSEEIEMLNWVRAHGVTPPVSGG
jgi:hypothetical protein